MDQRKEPWIRRNFAGGKRKGKGAMSWTKSIKLNKRLMCGKVSHDGIGCLK